MALSISGLPGIVDNLTREERRNDAIDDSICRGCR
jgi:hypothetical protein